MKTKKGLILGGVLLGMLGITGCSGLNDSITLSDTKRVESKDKHQLKFTVNAEDDEKIYTIMYKLDGEPAKHAANSPQKAYWSKTAPTELSFKKYIDVEKRLERGYHTLEATMFDKEGNSTSTTYKFKLRK